MSAAARKPRTHHPVLDRVERQRKARRSLRILCERNFGRYCQEAWHVLEGAKPLEWTPFHQGLCDELQFLAEGWLAARGVANREQLLRVMATWERHGLMYEEGEVLVQNECFNLAPGTLKSTIIMVMFPTWVWLHFAAASFVGTSGVDENVDRDSNRCRELVESEWYRRTFEVPWKMKGKGAVRRWHTTAGGRRISRPWLGGWSGVHVDFFLMDDPIDATTVWNDPARKAVNLKFTNSMENRVNDPTYSIRIMAHQRIHAEDPSGYVRALSKWTPEERKGWAIFAIPMRFGYGPGPANDNETAELYQSPFGWVDPRSEKGAVMQPGRFPPSFIADEIRKKGTAGFLAQLDQNPNSLVGGWFPKSLWRFFRVEGADSDWLTQVGVAPRARPDGCSNEAAYVLKRTRAGALMLDWLTLSIDASGGSTEKTASGVGLTVIGGAGLRRFIFDDRTRVMTYLDMIAEVKKTIGIWNAKRVLIELKANGGPMFETLRKEVADGKFLGPDGKKIVVVVEAYNPGRTSKEERAHSMLPDVEAGLWFLLDGAHWIPEFFSEVAPFPNHPKKDRVDTLTQVSIKYSSHNDARRKALALSKR